MLRLGILAGLTGVLAVGGAGAQQPAKTPPAAPGGTIQGSIDGIIPGTPADGAPQGSQTAPGGAVPGATPLGNSGYRLVSPLIQPTLSPGVVELMELEGRFSEDVAAGGGKALATWFADDAVVLNNGKPAVLGRGAIAAQAQWDPKRYRLTWTAQGAQMGPSNDMGFTWGRYEGHSTDAKGQPVITSGRYMTVWKKTRDAGWKVALDASATEPAGAGDCCTLPSP
jgi:ketosteroid isomerase-like protein